ncbi:MAG: hypothetical protein N2036_04600 [Bryobacteraceae bacterium]|nr:hypothetical protein [Bryobacteraceae bacterium]
MLALAVFGCLAAAAQQYQPLDPLRPETILLARIRSVVSENLARLPDFTCVETIERSQRDPGSRRFRFLDNIRLEVALVEGKELYAWPGSPRFEERDLRDMVGGGAIGTGDFALHARSIYLSGSARFTYQGVEELRGRKVHVFHYRVPMSESRYIMRIEKTEGPVGYQGHVYNDAETLEIARIEIHIDEIPPYLPLKEGHKVIDYAPMDIGGVRHVLPVSMDMTLVGLNGGESRNRAVFSGCRQYQGASRLVFEAPPPDAPAPQPPVQWALPEGLEVRMRLVEALDLAKAAMGDPVVFEVTRDAARGGTVWLPKGARVTLRMDHIACRDYPVSHCFFALAPGTFFFENKSGEFRAELVLPDLARSMELLLRNVRPQLRMIPVEMGQAAPGSAILLVSGQRGKLPGGFSTVWRTLNTRGEQQP